MVEVVPDRCTLLRGIEVRFQASKFGLSKLIRSAYPYKDESVFIITT